MAIKIAVPNNELSSALFQNYENIKDKYELNLLKVTEDKAFELLTSSRVDLALMNPLSYGKSIDKSNLRIIPGPALSSKSYTSIANIVFKSGLDEIDSLLVDKNIFYLSQIAILILKEKYNLHPENIQQLDDLSKAKEFDAYVTASKIQTEKSLDISEEWFDTFEVPLPLYFWVCRAEEAPEKYDELLVELANIEKTELHIHEHLHGKDYFPREGSIGYKFNDEFEQGLEQTLQMLFYHQYFKAIPAIKVLGREEPKENSTQIKIDSIEVN